MERIFIFIETGGPGGAERVVLSLAEGFAAESKQVTVCTLRTGWLTEQLQHPDVQAAGIRYIQLQSASAFDITLPFRLARLIRQANAQVLHTHLLDSTFYGALAAKLARVPHLGTEHGDIHHINRRKFFTLKLKTLASLNTQFSAVSRYTADELVRNGIPRANVNVIGNPIQLAPPVAGGRQSAREELGIDLNREREWLWLHVANLRKVKDQTTLIRGFAAAAKRSSVAQKLVIVGDGDLRPALVRLAEQEGVGGKVVFLGFRDDVARWLYAADGFILTSVSEAMPMAILEAASAGLLIVSSSVGGVPEVISHGRTGYLFTAKDHNQLAAVLERATGAIPASLALAAAGRNSVTAQFSLAAICEQFARSIRNQLTAARTKQQRFYPHWAPTSHIYLKLGPN